MTGHRAAAALLILGSVSLLLGALAFEYIGGLAPCALCMTQRWSHVAVILAASSLLLHRNPPRLWGILAAAASLHAAGQGFRHAGVELGWWAGPTTCSGTSQLIGQSGAELLDFSQPVRVVRCTDVAWELLGVSMAGWNGIITLAIGIAAFALWRAKRPRKEVA